MEWILTGVNALDIPNKVYICFECKTSAMCTMRQKISDILDEFGKRYVQILDILKVGAIDIRYS